MTLHQSALLLGAVARADATATYRAALAARMAWADGKAWTKFAEAMTHGA